MMGAAELFDRLGEATAELGKATLDALERLSAELADLRQEKATRDELEPLSAELAELRREVDRLADQVARRRDLQDLEGRVYDLERSRGDR